MITKKQLAEGYALNLRLIEMQTAGLSHSDSLIQTPYNINCLNWELGHIAVGRDMFSDWSVRNPCSAKQKPTATRLNRTQ